MSLSRWEKIFSGSMTTNAFKNMRFMGHQAVFQQNYDLSQVVSEAEKLVGYPTSFLNLRWLLTDELANIALHFRKLLHTNHPVLETARKLFIGNSMPTWGLIVLLISKAGGLNSSFKDNEKDVTAGVLHSQRSLAEITEMIRTSNLIHRSMLNVDKSKEDITELNFGNKISLLSGDFLLAKSYQELASLRNQPLNEMISASLRDLVDAEFIGPRDEQDRPLPCKPTNLNTVVIQDHFNSEPYEIKEALGNPQAEWLVRNTLSGGTLLARACQGALGLANHDQEVQNLGFLFGKNVALTWQAQLDQAAFSPSSSGQFSLVSAPVMFHLESDSSFYDEFERRKGNIADLDYENLREIVRNGCGLEKTKELQKKLSGEALRVLNYLPCSHARTALENIINTMVQCEY